MRTTNLAPMLLTAVGALALAATTRAYAADEVGVASCDAFLATYSSCVASKAPEAQRETMSQMLDQTRVNWKAVAATPDGKAKLDAVCKDTAAQMKQQVAALNCAW